MAINLDLMSSLIQIKTIGTHNNENLYYYIFYLIIIFFRLGLVLAECHTRAVVKDMALHDRTHSSTTILTTWWRAHSKANLCRRSRYTCLSTSALTKACPSASTIVYCWDKIPLYCLFIYFLYQKLCKNRKKVSC